MQEDDCGAEDLRSATQLQRMPIFSPIGDCETDSEEFASKRCESPPSKGTAVTGQSPAEADVINSPQPQIDPFFFFLVGILFVCAC